MVSIMDGDSPTSLSLIRQKTGSDELWARGTVYVAYVPFQERIDGMLLKIYGEDGIAMDERAAQVWKDPSSTTWDTTLVNGIDKETWIGEWLP
jgi:hypothetical protein